MTSSFETTARPTTTPRPLQTQVEQAAPGVPDYLNQTYFWSYLNPRNVRWLDREWVVRLILWCQHKRLKQAAFDAITPGSRVLQAAAVYGHFSTDLAHHLGPEGDLQLIDIAQIQVEITQEKLARCKNARIHRADAATFSGHHYNTVLSYFLLHEVPDDYKARILNNLLNCMAPEGQLVIVDYHKPHAYHPLKPIMSVVFDTLEPYAKSLWQHPLEYFAEHANQYSWQKQTLFGGMYQKLVVKRKKE